MRVNIYAEEMTDKVELIHKTNDEGTFTGIRCYLELPVTQHLLKIDGSGLTQQIKGPFIHRPGDDDSSAVTFWGKTQLKGMLKQALELLERFEETKQPTLALGSRESSETWCVPDPNLVRVMRAQGLEMTVEIGKHCYCTQDNKACCFCGFQRIVDETNQNQT